MSTEEMQRLDFGAGYGEGRCPQCGATRSAPELHGTVTGRWSSVPVPVAGPGFLGRESSELFWYFMVSAEGQFPLGAQTRMIRARDPEHATEVFRAEYFDLAASAWRLSVRRAGAQFPCFTLGLSR